MQFSKIFIIILLCSGFSNAEEITHFEELHIKNSKNEILNFSVEIADNPQKQAKGLMHREFMHAHEGMLFVFRLPRIVNIWMKNTHIPLDIIYIGKGGIIEKIVKNATPGSLKTHSSDVSVVAVLEINAMMTQSHNIEVGDVVIHPFFNNLNIISDNTDG